MGYILGGGLTLPAGLSSNNSKPAKNPKLETWSEVRSQFSLDKGKIHMALMLLSSHPKPVQDAIDMHRERFNANPTEYWENHFQTVIPRITNAAAQYLNCKPGEIALTDSTTQGLGTLYNGFKLDTSDEILTTTHDHYSTEKALDYAVTKTGASLNRISLYENPSEASVDEILGNLKAGITPNTKLVAVTWVHSSTGVKLPIKKMSELIQEVNAKRSSGKRIYLAVDGVHGFGVEDITMESMGCDFFVAGTHKWLFGPRGTGIIWAKEDAWDQIIPTIPPFSREYAVWLGLMSKDVLTFSDRFTPGGFHAFEHRWSLDTAFHFHQEIGKSRVEERTHYLNVRLKKELKQMSHVTLHTPISSELSAGINCFEVEGLGPAEIVNKLYEQRIVASTSPYRESYARLTPCIINTEEEVMTCIKAVQKLKI